MFVPWMQETEYKLAEEEKARKRYESRARSAEAALQERQQEVRCKADALADMQAQLDRSHAACSELESRLHQVQRSGSHASRESQVAQLQEKLDTATQWGSHLEASCTQLEVDVEQLQQQLLEQGRELSASGSRLRDAESELQAALLALQTAQEQLNGHPADNGSDNQAEEELEALRAQLQSSQQLIGQLQASLRAKEHATKVSSPALAAQMRAGRRSAGEVLQDAASSIEDRIREQSSELVSTRFEQQAPQTAQLRGVHLVNASTTALHAHLW